MLRFLGSIMILFAGVGAVLPWVLFGIPKNGTDWVFACVITFVCAVSLITGVFVFREDD